MKKVLIFLLSICFLMTTAASIVGFIMHNKEVPPEEPKPIIKLFSIDYYLENEKIDSMPMNTEEEPKKYIFSSYVCTNGLTGTFDTEAWTFTPSENKESVCSLYFVKSEYKVEITATNGTVQNTEDGVFTIQRENEGQFNVVPNEGYKYKSVICSNEVQAVYDLSSSTLTINSVMEDITCQVNFELQKFKVTINVVNGTGSTTENAKYGNSVSAIVKAKDGYEKPTIKCTNSQSGTLDNNTFTIEKLTDNTTCTITYKKIPIETFTLKINLTDDLTIIAGNSSQKIQKGTDGNVSIQTEPGQTVSLSCNVKPSSTTTDPDGVVKFVFLNVTQDITCTASPSQ